MTSPNKGKHPRKKKDQPAEACAEKHVGGGGTERAHESGAPIGKR